MLKNLDINSIKSEFNKSGYVVIPSFFTENREFLDLKDHVEYLIKASAKKNNIPTDNKNIPQLSTEIFNSNKEFSSEIYNNLNASPFLLRALSSILMHNFAKLFFQGKTSVLQNNLQMLVQIPHNDKVGSFPWHQDSHYNQLVDVSTGSFAAWCSLVDIEKNMGPVIFKKGSNILGEVEKVQAYRPSGMSIFTIEEKLTSSKRFKEVAPLIKAGDLVLIHMHVFHKSGINISDQTKFTMVSRFHKSNL